MHSGAAAAGAGVSAFFSRPPSSAAVKIVRPQADGAASASTTGASPSKSPSKLRDSGSPQICRDFMLNGSCKKADCRFYHPSSDARTAPGSPEPAFEAQSPSLALAEAVNAPVFVPKNPALSASPPPARSAVSSPIPAAMSQSFEDYEHYVGHDAGGETQVAQPGMEYLTNSMQAFNPYDQPMDGQQMAYPSEYDQYDPGYYAPNESTFIRQPLDYHLYTLPIPEVFSHNYFIGDDVREELQRRAETLRALPPAGLARDLPEELQGYHSLAPLEPLSPERRKFGNWYSTVYKAVSEKDGVTYVLRRIESYRLALQAGLNPVETWSRLRHPNIVAVREGFTTRAFGDNSLVVAYDHHPAAQTLAEVYLKPSALASPPPALVTGGRAGARRNGAAANRISERTLWSFIVQIANAVKAVHEAGMAVRVLDASKILVTGKNRVRISSCGIVDVLMYDARPPPDMGMLQQEDLAAFGRLVFALCCGNPAAVNNLPKALESIARNYSADVKNVALFLMSKPTPHKNVSQLFDMLGSRLLTEIDEMQNAVDRLEGELMSELENGRLVRLLCKFGFINERPEFARDARWSETGDRYIIKLFRDYVFHQVDEFGNPVVNLGHVLTCLSKLDAGSEERVMLISRDEQSCLVVSYKEVKSCIESAYGELVRPPTTAF